MWPSIAKRFVRAQALCLAAALLFCFPRTAAAEDEVFFSAITDVAAKLAERIYAEPERIDMSAWYLTDSTVRDALLYKHRNGLKIRLIGDRGSIFEIDQNTKNAFYLLASEGVPIRLRYHPTWYPEIDHWKATIFAGQKIVAFGSANYTPFELAPWSPTNYKDEITLFTSDSAIVNAFKTKFDRYWHDTDGEPESLIPTAPYFKNWDDACASEAACSDYRTLYPNAPRTNPDTSRLENDYPLPPEIVWGQGSVFNNRLVSEINKEQTALDFVIYRLTVDNITDALLAKKAANLPMRIIIEPDEYLNRKWPEFWITHANVDKLWAAQIPMKMRVHTGLTHMKVLITSTVATIASSNYAAAWQRDHDYFMPASAKPAIYTAIKNRFQAMWTDTAGFADFRPQGPDAPNPASPGSGSTGVSTTPTLTWDRAVFATSYDVYLGTSPSAMSLAGNVPAQMVNNPPATYSFTPASPLVGSTTYYWKVVSRTNATPRDPNMIASSSLQSFTTAGGGTPPPSGGPLPSPWQTQDVGGASPAGSASYSNGVFTVAGGGADIWGTADAFRYVYQTTNGDSQIIAKVTSIPNTSTSAKAGVMLRASLAAGAAHVILDVKPDGGIEFMTRTAANGSTTYLAGSSQGLPAWLKLARVGNTVTGYVSGNGSTWTMVGSTTTTMAASANIGLLVNSHNTAALNTSTFDNVTVTAGTTPPPSAPAPPSSPSPSNGATGVSTNPTLTWTASGATSYDVRFGTASSPPTVATGQATSSYTPSSVAANTTYFWQIVAKNSAGNTTGPIWSFRTAAAAAGLPTPWAHQDVGSTVLTGNASFSNGSFTVAGAGADVWGSTDAFHYVSQTTPGDVQVVARVSALQNTHQWAKAGLMIRKSLTADSAHVLLNVTPGGTIEFMTRASDGASASLLAYGTQSAPAWLRLVRTGSTITASVSANGSTWTDLGSTPTTIPSSAFIGLVVTSHDVNTLNTATFDNVTVTTPPSPPPPTEPPPAATDIVVYASDIPAGSIHGNWALATDSTSPSSKKLVTPDNAAPTVDNPVAPVHYVDVPFSANANTPYTIWLRMQATGNSKYNDAVWVQFSDALANGAPAYQMNSPSGLLVNLATSAAASSLNGWGWQNTAYWLSQVTTVTFATSGPHTLRIQTREDGVQFDQVVLSPTTYLTASPGSVTNDSKIVSKP